MEQFQDEPKALPVETIKEETNGDYMDNETENVLPGETEFQFSISSQGVRPKLNDDFSWECKKCSPRTIHSNLIDLLVHSIRDHQNLFKFQCNLCREVLGSAILLAKHFKNHSKINFSLFNHSNFDVACRNNAPVSPEPISEDDSDSEPLAKIAGPKFKEFKASKSPKNCESAWKVRHKFTKKSKIIGDVKTERKPNTGLCDLCGKCYKGTFRKHERECQGTDGAGLGINLLKNIKTPRQKHVKTSKGYLCSYCGKTFNKSCSLQTHYRVHTGEKPYHCSECGKDFSNRPNLKRHVLIHTGEKPYLCTLCGKAFNHPWTFKTHSYTHAGPRSVRLKPHGKKYSCEFCNKEFEARSTLEMHIRVHTKERPYQCSYCTKRFSQKSSLNQHILNHTGHKPHKCQYCMKTFKYLVCLKTHVRTHTGERPYKCAVCDKAFSSQSNLYRHRATHTGVKRFKCDYCGKEFGQRSALGDHINIHTGARPYSCPHCTSCFANQSTLSKHVSKHVTKNNFKQELPRPQPM